MHRSSGLRRCRGSAADPATRMIRVSNRNDRQENAHMGAATGPTTIDNLQKVTLRVEAGTQAEDMNLTREPEQFAFIFGIGATGLTPFEYRLAAKSPGDEVCLQIPPHRWPVYFRHIALPVRLPPALESDVYLKVRVKEVRAAAGREVVKALAEMAECGGCDCGCGGHGGAGDAESGGSLER